MILLESGPPGSRVLEICQFRPSLVILNTWRFKACHIFGESNGSSLPTELFYQACHSPGGGGGKGGGEGRGVETRLYVINTRK